MPRILFVLAALALAVSTRGDEPLQSADALEANIRSCLLKDKDAATCLERTLRGHFSPGNEKLNEMVAQVAGIFRKWLGEDKVFAVHAVKAKKLGEFYDERVYLVEDSTGNLIMLETGVVQKNGRSWLHRFNLSSQKERISAVLGVNL